MGRASFFEHAKVNPELNNQPTMYKFKGPHTKFTMRTNAGDVRYTVNTELDEEEQRKAFDIFNDKFRSIQNYFIHRLNTDQLTEDQGHDGRWICVSAGIGDWKPNKGSWKMLPEEVNCDEKVNDEFLKSDDGKAMILRKNYAGVFCLPRNHEFIMMVPRRVPVIM
jgi:hypothetical protein